VEILMLAKDWGIPPWQVEAAPFVWIERARLLRDALADAREADRRRSHGRPDGVGGLV
jgi:hypothetical protein